MHILIICYTCLINNKYIWYLIPQFFVVCKSNNDGRIGDDADSSDGDGGNREQHQNWYNYCRQYVNVMLLKNQIKVYKMLLCLLLEKPYLRSSHFQYCPHITSYNHTIQNCAPIDSKQDKGPFCGHFLK